VLLDQISEGTVYSSRDLYGSYDANPLHSRWSNRHTLRQTKAIIFPRSDGFIVRIIAAVAKLCPSRSRKNFIILTARLSVNSKALLPLLQREFWVVFISLSCACCKRCTIYCDHAAHSLVKASIVLASLSPRSGYSFVNKQTSKITECSDYCLHFRAGLMMAVDSVSETYFVRKKKDSRIRTKMARFQVLTATSVRMTFSAVVPCCLV
jgi:hypothetical protein